jgi:hypothetical protein
MFWLGGMLALEVTTSTPDALCPPLAEARAAIEARVGVVQAQYHVNYELVRGADGEQALRLRVLLDGQPLLVRELPLGERGCDDAAQAIALVLERYFDAIETATPDKPATKLEPVPETTPLSQITPTSDRARHQPVQPVATTRVGASLLFDRELGLGPSLLAELRPRLLQASPRLRLAWGVSLSTFVSSQTQTIREQNVRARTLQLATWLPVELELGTWATWLGPWAQLRFQRAEGVSREHDAAYRSLPGVGGGWGLSWSPRSTAWTLALNSALGAQLGSESARFVLRDAGGEHHPVLTPDSWFVQTSLGALFRL